MNLHDFLYHNFDTELNVHRFNETLAHKFTAVLYSTNIKSKQRGHLNYKHQDYPGVRSRELLQIILNWYCLVSIGFSSPKLDFQKFYHVSSLFYWNVSNIYLFERYVQLPGVYKKLMYKKCLWLQLTLWEFTVDNLISR